MDVRRAERASGRTKCDVPSRASGRCREIDRLFSECGGRVDQRGSHSCPWHLKPACLTNPERFVRHAAWFGTASPEPATNHCQGRVFARLKRGAYFHVCRGDLCTTVKH